MRVELLPEQPHSLVVEVVVGGDAAEGEGREGPLILERGCVCVLCVYCVCVCVCVCVCECECECEGVW